jgi:hypothetical protein
MTPDPDAERFLLLLAAQRSPRTVDAYRRDLNAFAASRGGPLAADVLPAARPARRPHGQPGGGARAAAAAA